MSPSAHLIEGDDRPVESNDTPATWTFLNGQPQLINLPVNVRIFSTEPQDKVDLFVPINTNSSSISNNDMTE